MVPQRFAISASLFIDSIVSVVVAGLFSSAALADNQTSNTVEQFWSFRPVHRPDPPRVKDQNWPINAVDHFILSKLEERGLQPAPPATRAELARRLYFDLIGLPPSPEQLASFLGDKSAHATERLVDQLLNSP